MPSNYRNIADGLKTILKNNVTSPRGGINVYDHPPDSIQTPALFIMPAMPQARFVIGGNSFTFQFRVVLLTFSADASEGFYEIYDALDPTNAGSVVKAIRDNRTLNSQCDDADVVAVENVGRRQFGDSFYLGCDIVVEGIKSVA